MVAEKLQHAATLIAPSADYSQWTTWYFSRGWTPRLARRRSQDRRCRLEIHRTYNLPDAGLAR